MRMQNFIKRLSLLGVWSATLCGLASSSLAADTKPTVAPETQAASEAPAMPTPTTVPVAITEPWEYSPYRIKIWVAGDSPRVGAAALSGPLREYLDRYFFSIWQTTISDAPLSVRIAARRDLEAINYQSITAADPVLAVKRDHVEAARIRVASDVAMYVKKCLTTTDRLAAVKARGAAAGNATLDGVVNLMETIQGDSIAVAAKWSDADVESVLLSRGMTMQLDSPEAKIIRLPIDDLVAEDVEDHDKIFVVRIDSEVVPMTVEVVELDCLMRVFSPIIRRSSIDHANLPAVVGQGIIDAFGPLVRIEDAGAKNAWGLVRAAGLIVDNQKSNGSKPASTDAAETVKSQGNPAMIREGEFLQPMVRKNDRNGNPIAIGPIPWAYLHVVKVEGARVDMELYAGRVGGIQGRKNGRTFRMAVRTRPVSENSIIRLHAQGNAKEPLIGYEVYEKELKSIDMTMVGRTNWDGKIVIEKSDAPMRLLYVKNGGAVLARLPIVPGLYPVEVADLVGDDQRLRAEAYIRGTQNAIVDLIAIRTLFAARIRLRMEKGQMDEAKDLLNSLKNEPSYDVIANDMGKKVTQIKGRNPSEQKKIDFMFAQTREMLVANINGKLILDLEAEVAKAEANGGVLKRKPKAEKSE